MRSLPGRRPLIVLAVALLAVVAVLTGIATFEIYRGQIHNLDPIATMTHPLRTDFAQYYRDSLVAVRQGGRDIYNVAAFQRVTASLGLVRLESDPNVVLSLPLLVWFGIPFTVLPLGAAYVAWTILLAACLIFAWAVATPASGWSKLAYLAPAVAFLPTVFALALGQATLLTLGVVAGSWWLLKHGHEAWAGVVLALLMLKPQLAFLVPVALLIAGRRRTFVFFAGTSLLLLAVAIVLIPMDSISEYLGRLLQAGRNPGAWNVNTSLTVAGEGGGWLGLVQQALVLAAASFALRRYRATEVRDEAAIVIGLLGSLLLTPYLHYPDLAILMLAWWLFLRMQPVNWSRWFPLIFVATAAFEPFGVPLTRIAELVWLASLAIGPVTIPLRMRARGASLQKAGARP